MMAISANPNYGMEWHKLWPQEEGGTNLFRMYTFIERIIDQLAIDWPVHSFCFTMDNLNIHHNPVLFDNDCQLKTHVLFHSAKLVRGWTDGVCI